MALLFGRVYDLLFGCGVQWTIPYRTPDGVQQNSAERDATQCWAEFIEGFREGWRAAEADKAK